VFETIGLFSTMFVKILDYYYSVYPSPSETVRGSNFYLQLVFITLFYPMPLCDKNGE
jgi:hypothetical protein